MKLLIINNQGITTYYFNGIDSQTILTRCKAAGKAWSDHLVGFFINTTSDGRYVAINIKGEDETIESMEYIDLEKNQPEFTVSDDFLIRLTNNSQPDITLAEFEPILNNILTAPVKQRRWEVYAEINKKAGVLH